MKIADLIAKIGVDTRELDRGLGQAQRKFKAFGKNTKRLGASMTAGITAPLGAIAGVSFKVAADFEQSMAQVAAVSGASAEEFKRLEKNALDLGSSTKFTASEVSGLQLEFAKLGFTTGEIENVTEATLNLAQASGSDLARSAEVAGATLRGFGMDASETGHVTDVMAAAFSSSALDMGLFADSMKYVAPVAKSAGMSIEQTSGMLAALANAGIKGSQAGTALRRIIQELGSTGGDVAGAIQNLASEGLNLADAKDEVGRSAQSALLVLSQNMGAVGQLTTQFQNADGAASDMAKTMSDTATGDMARMQSALEGAQITIGRALAPTITKLMGFISDLATRFKNLSEGTRSTIITFAAIAAAMGPVLYILPQLLSGMKLFASGVMKLAPKIATSFATMGWPLTLVIGVLAALVSAFFYFWDDIKKPLANAINAVIDLYNESEGVRIGVALLKQTFVANFTAMKTAVLAVFKSFGLLVTVISVAFSDGFEAAYDVAMEGVEDIKNDVVESGGEIYDGFVDAVDKAKKEKPIEFVTTGDLDAARDRITGLMDFSGTFTGGSRTAQGLENKESGPANVEPLQAIAPALDVMPEKMLLVADATDKATESTTNFNREVATTIDLSGGIADGFIGIGEGIAAMATGTMTMKGFLGDMLERLGDLLKQIGAGFITAAVAAKKFYANLIANPAAAIAAGVAFVAAGALVSSLGARLAEAPPQLAEGGIAFGRSLVEVGEYSNASVNPEVIAPLDKLQNMIGAGGAQNINVTGRISGKDILLSMDRAGQDRKRIQGR